ncbi:MAG: hypothetical protein M0C28_15570 [Candidatus Moduliflexus flocculans]|nr:hypothetical protein [Candidatus Moduliflexus flocculans]
MSQLALDKGVEVHTPDASFYVLEEGLYRFDVALDRDTRASVREGSLEAAAEDGSVLVSSQESVTAADGRLLGDPQSAGSREDGFDDWNGSRDAQLSARSERQYLPSEMGEYEEELDQNGQWVYEGSYGNVWVPNVSHYDDWRPYYYGRWVWYPIIGWTWVSSESWGWPVYHYGRWNWRFGLGWYWIPQRHWGPAWVHWWHDRDYIGWCPLTWYNRPGYLVDNRFYDRSRRPLLLRPQPGHDRRPPRPPPGPRHRPPPSRPRRSRPHRPGVAPGRAAHDPPGHRQVRARSPGRPACPERPPRQPQRGPVGRAFELPVPFAAEAGRGRLRGPLERARRRSLQLGPRRGRPAFQPEFRDRRPVHPDLSEPADLGQPRREAASPAIAATPSPRPPAGLPPKAATMPPGSPGPRAGRPRLPGRPSAGNPRGPARPKNVPPTAR